MIIALERDVSAAAHWREEDYFRVFEPASVPRLALIVQEELQVAGFLIASVAGDDWEIENIVVRSDARRRGLGLRLVGELATRALARGARNLSLEVRESNAAARRLYEKCEFEIVGRRRAYYANPEEDALLYSRAIASEAPA